MSAASRAGGVEATWLRELHLRAAPVPSPPSLRARWQAGLARDRARAGAPCRAGGELSRAGRPERSRRPRGLGVM